MAMMVRFFKKGLKCGAYSGEPPGPQAPFGSPSLGKLNGLP
jgi:hypothetical protein